MDFPKNKVTINGLELCYYSTAERGHKLICIHGGPGLDSTTFFPAFLELSDQFQLYFLDLRGNGYSEAPTGDEYSLKDYSTDIEAFVSTVIGKKAESLGILGHSFGGSVVIEALSHCEALFDYAVLFSSPFNSSWISDLMKYYENNKDPEVDKAETEYAKSQTDENFNLVTQAYWGYYFPELEMVKAKSIIKNWTYKHVPYDYSNAHIMPSLDLEEKLGKISLPSLVIGGDKDLIIPWSHLEDMHSKISNSKLSCIKNTGHFSFLTQIKTVKNEIQKFFNDRVGK